MKDRRSWDCSGLQDPKETQPNALSLKWILDWKNRSHEGHFGDNRRNCSIDWMLDIEFMMIFLQSVLM